MHTEVIGLEDFLSNILPGIIDRERHNLGWHDVTTGWHDTAGKCSFVLGSMVVATSERGFGYDVPTLLLAG